MNNIGEVLNAHLADISVPLAQTKVYKDECIYSFDTPFTDTGLYVCLKTFYGLGKEHLERHHRKTGSCVYLHMKFEKIPLESDETTTELSEEKKVTRLAIGVQGGFDADPLAKKYDTRKNYSVVILPQLIIVPWPNDALPEKVVNAVSGVIEAESAYKLMELESNTWDGEIRCVSKHAHNLKQLDNNRRIRPSGWKCEKCDLTTNLWLNLTDGSILCGRKFFDGSGGNDHALHHYRETKYPLAVKLGTITNDGKGDVFSYDEDDMVEDPLLIDHLAHFGINMANMRKTDKSMVELELDLNQKFGEWMAIQESGSDLKPVYGPGYTGLMNLGNSCYLNSTMQVVFTVPAFVARYVENATTIFDGVVGNPVDDFNVQMAKLGVGLLSGKYSRPPVNEVDNSFSVTPTMFKNIVSKGHPQFCTKNQQDAQEFFLYLISRVQRFGRHQVDPTTSFKFKIEERYQCHASGKVQYQYRDDYCLPIMIPMEAAVNKDEVEAFAAKQAQNSANGNRTEPSEVVRPLIRFSSCLEAFTQSELVDQFYSAAIKGKTTASKTTRISQFPDYLLLHLKKYTLRDDWTPIKLDVRVDMPDTLDLSVLKGNGVQSGEELLPSEEVVEETVQFNDAHLNQLVDMGFPLEACKWALYSTRNTGVESAACWLMEHMDDPIMMQPFTARQNNPTKAGGDFVVDEEALATIMSLGFSRNQAIRALRETDNNVERAADWVFNHPVDDVSDVIDEVDALAPSTGRVETVPNIISDSETNFKYRLKAFISHMGTSTAVGHYVCHILKEGNWVIFNDEKVALSENPPKDLGYVYMYERI